MEDTAQLTKMKVADLKKELKNRGLATTGNKTELVERLQEALKEGGNVAITTGEGDDDEFDEEEILKGGDDMDAAEIGKITPQEEEAALRGSIKDLEQKKKVSLKRTEPTPAAAGEVATENGAAGPEKKGEEKAEAEDGEPKKKVIKVDGDANDKTAVEARAERFGVPLTEEAKKQVRAARFAGTTNGTIDKKPASLSMETGGTDMDKLKARAERFGEVVSKSLTKADEDEKKKARAARFAGATTTTTTTTETADTTTEEAPAKSSLIMSFDPAKLKKGKAAQTPKKTEAAVTSPEDDELKKKRAARFAVAAAQ